MQFSNTFIRRNEWSGLQPSDHIVLGPKLLNELPFSIFCMINKQNIVLLLTHRGRVMHICIGKLTIGSDDGLSPGRCQAIIWTNAGTLLIRPLGTITIYAFSFKKMHCKMSSGKSWPFCLGLNVLKEIYHSDTRKQKYKCAIVKHNNRKWKSLTS